MEIADIEGADAVSHGATGKGNDQVRFELAYLAIDPDIKIIAPWREWDLNSRTALMAFAEKHGIEVPTTRQKPYSTDRNLLHISYEGGMLEDPWNEPPEDMFILSVSPQEAPDKPEIIEITFEQGNPVAINGQCSVAGRAVERAKQARRQTRHRPDRYRGKPVRGDEIPGGL